MLAMLVNYSIYVLVCMAVPTLGSVEICRGILLHGLSLFQGQQKVLGGKGAKSPLPLQIDKVPNGFSL